MRKWEPRTIDSTSSLRFQHSTLSGCVAREAGEHSRGCNPIARDDRCIPPESTALRALHLGVEFQRTVTDHLQFTTCSEQWFLRLHREGCTNANVGKNNVVCSVFPRVVHERSEAEVDFQCSPALVDIDRCCGIVRGPLTLYTWVSVLQLQCPLTLVADAGLVDSSRASVR